MGVTCSILWYYADRMQFEKEESAEYTKQGWTHPFFAFKQFTNKVFTLWLETSHHHPLTFSNISQLSTLSKLFPCGCLGCLPVSINTHFRDPGSRNIREGSTFKIKKSHQQSTIPAFHFGSKHMEWDILFLRKNHLNWKILRSS